MGGYRGGVSGLDQTNPGAAAHGRADPRRGASDETASLGKGARAAAPYARRRIESIAQLVLDRQNRS
ncbi:hypothetical protein GCM10010270_80020 [Streptomyces violaceus]|nr:hypothetical protein GCM10010270_80020 [Streptomyces janthinus]